MKKAKKSNLFLKAMLFMDGKDGFFESHQDVLHGDESTGVVMVSKGKRGEKTKRLFVTNSESFDNVKDALLAAGWDLGK